MWFCVVLFALSLTYACLRLLSDRPEPEPWSAIPSSPSLVWNLTFLLAMAIGCFVVRALAWVGAFPNAGVQEHSLSSGVTIGSCSPSFL
jgi:hypothetical protein